MTQILLTGLSIGTNSSNILCGGEVPSSNTKTATNTHGPIITIRIGISWITLASVGNGEEVNLMLKTSLLIMANYQILLAQKAASDKDLY